ncbi:MAG: proprotein convertase P-domain-containing protein [Rudaea sp.]
MKTAVSAALAALCFLSAVNVSADQRSLGDLTPGSANSFLYQQESSLNVAYLNGHTYFVTAGCKLWKSDGSAATTVLAADFSSGDTSCMVTSFGSLARVNSKIILIRSTSPKLVVTDGTQADTVPLNVPNLNNLDSLRPWDGNPGYVVLTTDDHSSAQEVWATDGTLANTIRLAQLGGELNVALAFMTHQRLAIGSSNGLWLAEDPATPATQLGSGFNNVGSQFNSTGRGLVSSGDSLYFTASDAAHGQEIWFSDLTSVGTHVIKDITPGPSDSNISLDKVDGAGRAYFTIGDVLWRTDGTSANTFPLTVPGQVITNFPVQVVGDAVIFDGLENDGHHLWKSDGTLAGTAEYTSKFGSSFILGTAVNFGDVLDFAVQGSATLYAVSDVVQPYPIGLIAISTRGAPIRAGRSRVIPGEGRSTIVRNDHDFVDSVINGVPGSSNSNFAVGGSMLYFAASQTTTGLEPYAVDLVGSNAAVCSSPNQHIPDNTTRGLIDAIAVPQHATIGNLTVDLRLSHPYIGDISATLTHVSTGHSVTLIQQASRCESDDLDVVFDDAATIPFDETTCSSDPDGQAFPAGTYLKPGTALSAFIGDDVSGLWELNVVDNAAGDTGGITQWCLDITGVTDRIFSNGFEVPPPN